MTTLDRGMFTRVSIALAALVAVGWPGLALAAEEATLTVTAAGAPSAGLLAAFYIIGALVVVGAVATISMRNPVVAAVCLVGTLFASAGLYLLLHATFMAAIQVMVYAGAIMVLFVFVIMAVEHPEKEDSGLLQGTVTKMVGALAVVLLFFRVLTMLMGPEIKQMAPVQPGYGDVYYLGRLLFSRYLFPFEAISVLLLTAIVGAVVVSRRRAERSTVAEVEEGTH